MRKFWGVDLPEDPDYKAIAEASRPPNALAKMAEDQ
jgi:hypothetical protein